KNRSRSAVARCIAARAEGERITELFLAANCAGISCRPHLRELASSRCRSPKFELIVANYFWPVFENALTKSFLDSFCIEDYHGLIPLGNPCSCGRRASSLDELVKTCGASKPKRRVTEIARKPFVSDRLPTTVRKRSRRCHVFIKEG